MSLKKAFSKKAGRNSALLNFEDLFTDDDGSSLGSSIPRQVYTSSYQARNGRVTPRNTIGTGKLENGSVRITQPKTAAQRAYVTAIEGPSAVVVGCGPAGTGKTLFPCELACKYLEEGRFARVVLVRPAVAAQEDLGYLPGTVLEKLDPYLRPLYDVLETVHDKRIVRQMLDTGVLEACAIGYCRGRTFRDSFVIADEMQNATVDQVKMLLTRIGPGTKLVLTGDPMQHDRGYGSNGLSDFLERWKRMTDKEMQDTDSGDGESWKKDNAVEIVHFGRCDIQRSPVIERVLRAYEG